MTHSSVRAASPRPLTSSSREEQGALFSEGHNDQKILRHQEQPRGRPLDHGDGQRRRHPQWSAVQNVSEQNGRRWSPTPIPGGESPNVTREEFEKMWDKPMQGMAGSINGLADITTHPVISTRRGSGERNEFSIAATRPRRRRADIGTRYKTQDHLHQGQRRRALVTGDFGLAGDWSHASAPYPVQSGACRAGRDKGLDWARKSGVEKGGVGHKILGGIGFVGGGILTGLGWGVKQIGNGIAKVGHFIVAPSRGRQEDREGVKAVGGEGSDGFKESRPRDRQRHQAESFPVVSATRSESRRQLGGPLGIPGRAGLFLRCRGDVR